MFFLKNFLLLLVGAHTPRNTLYRLHIIAMPEFASGKDHSGPSRVAAALLGPLLNDEALTDYFTSIVDTQASWTKGDLLEGPLLPLLESTLGESAAREAIASLAGALEASGAVLSILRPSDMDYPSAPSSSGAPPEAPERLQDASNVLLDRPKW